MPEDIRTLLQNLSVDPWRLQVGFSKDVENANGDLFRLAAARERASTLAAWLGQYQPCFFGKLAAKKGQVEFCVLDRNDLQQGNDHVAAEIAQAKRRWTNRAFDGHSSAFVIAVVDRDVAGAMPDESLLGLARCLLALYVLEDEIETNRVYHDLIYLKKPGSDTTTWRWKVGINFFGAQGDRRWWNDHRFPGGFAFSMNSVGHMVKSTIVSRAMDNLDKALDVQIVDWEYGALDDLIKAHRLAMRTIANASNAVSGKATELAPRLAAEKCPELPAEFQEKSCLDYFGWYDTDETLPREYFDSAVERPATQRQRRLDFSYLIDASPDNFDHIHMGKGLQIRASDEPGFAAKVRAKLERAAEEEVEIEGEYYLRNVLAMREGREGG